MARPMSLMSSSTMDMLMSSLTTALSSVMSLQHRWNESSFLVPSQAISIDNEIDIAWCTAMHCYIFEVKLSANLCSGNFLQSRFKS